MAEWLRRWTRNPMGSARAGSNPAQCVFFLFFFSPSLQEATCILAYVYRNMQPIESIFLCSLVSCCQAE